MLKHIEVEYPTMAKEVLKLKEHYTVQFLQAFATFALLQMLQRRELIE